MTSDDDDHHVARDRAGQLPGPQPEVHLQPPIAEQHGQATLMEVVICADASTMADLAADAIQALLARRPRPSLRARRVHRAIPDPSTDVPHRPRAGHRVPCRLGTHALTCPDTGALSLAEGCVQFEQAIRTAGASTCRSSDSAATATSDSTSRAHRWPDELGSRPLRAKHETTTPASSTET